MKNLPDPIGHGCLVELALAAGFSEEQILAALAVERLQAMMLAMSDGGATVEEIEKELRRLVRDKDE